MRSRKKRLHRRVHRDREASARQAGLRPVAAAVLRQPVLGRGLLACLFLALYYAYLLWVVQPSIIYHSADMILPGRGPVDLPLYFRGFNFFREFLTRPGGLVEYAAAYGCQYYFHPRVGSLLLAGTIGLLFFLTVAWLRGVGIRGSILAPYVPPLLLLVPLGRYAFCLADVLAIIAAVAVADLYLLVSRRAGGVAGRAGFYVAAAATLYYAAGGGMLLFALLCALFELLHARVTVHGARSLPRRERGQVHVFGRRFLAKHVFRPKNGPVPSRPVNGHHARRRLLGVAYLAVAAAIPAAGGFLFDRPWADAYLRLSGVFPWGSDASAVVMAVLFLFYAATVIWPIVWPIVGRRLVRRVTFLPSYLVPGKRLRTVAAVGLLGVLGPAIAFGSLDRELRTLLRLNALARTEAWQAFLDELDRNPPATYTDSLLCDTIRALFETGRLPSKMFAYPQRPGVLFRVGETGVELEGGTEVLLQLGLVNEAEHTAQEAREMRGNRPRLLRQLALVNILKNRPEAAAVFLRALSRDVVYGPWAESRLDGLKKDPTLAADDEVGRLRSVMSRQDAVYFTRPRDQGLQSLLVANPRNRMAFEYLMAEYLLTRYPQGIVAEIGRLDTLGYRDIPPLYAEAIALYAHNTGKTPDLHGRVLAPEILQRVADVTAIARTAGDDKDKLDKALAERFPESVSRYFLVGRSGKTP